tara:strand:- start:534 stop:827 length:294 start_codon:yes stop_codon:yes gene_type:complete
MIKLKNIIEMNRIGNFTWSGHIERGRSLDNTVGGQPAGKSVPRRVAEDDYAGTPAGISLKNEFVGAISLGLLIKFLASYLKRNPQHMNKIKSFVKKL